MILYTLRSNIFIIRIIIIGNKKLNSIFDTESKFIHFMGSNKYLITKIKCWPVFKQDPISGHYVAEIPGLLTFFLLATSNWTVKQKIQFQKGSSTKFSTSLATMSR